MTSDDVHTRYVMLENHGHGVNKPPPYRRHVPQYHGYNDSRGCKCGKCICCCCCCIFIFILISVLLSLSLFLLVKPQMPSFNVDSMHVSHFDIQGVSKVYTEFNVVVKADNPNSDIGFEYGKGSSVNIIYSGTQISSGQIPAFLQPGKNITMIKMVLKGSSYFEAIQHQHMMNQKEHRIPLLIKVKVPVTLVLHGMQLREFMVYVNCSLVTDDLKKDKDVKILSKEYSYDFQF